MTDGRLVSRPAVGVSVAGAVVGGDEEALVLVRGEEEVRLVEVVLVITRVLLVVDSDGIEVTLEDDKEVAVELVSGRVVLASVLLVETVLLAEDVKP